MAAFGEKQSKARVAGSSVLALLVFLAMVWSGLAADDQTALLNLVLVDVSALPSAPIESGSTVELTAHVRLDSGIALESNAFVEFSLRRSDKPEACISEIVLVPPSAEWNSDTYTATASIATTNLAGGLYEVVATIRFDGPESSQHDNQMPFGFLAIEDPRPELHPISLSMDPAVPLQWGETATVRTAIENTGRLAAGTFYVVFSIRLQPTVIQDGTTQQTEPDLSDWLVVATKVVSGLARNAETQVAAALDLSAPEFGFTQQFIADYGDGSGVPFDLRASIEYAPSSVGELDPLNNSIYGAFSVLPSTLGLPDLVPVAITYDEDLPVTWDRELTVTVTIANIGGSDAQAGFCATFSYRPLGQPTWNHIVSRSLAAIPVEEEANQTTVWATLIDRDGLGPSGTPLELGSYELKVEVGCIDSQPACHCGGYSERSVGNNTLVVGFSVRGTELQAESLELSPMPIMQGDSVLVRTTVVNTGNRNAGEFLVGFYLDGERFDTFRYRDAQGLAEDQRTMVQGVLDTRDLPPGTYDLRVVVDPDDRIKEFDDEGNNTVSMPIEILGPSARRAELQIAGVRLSPSSPIPQASDLTAAVAIRNAGEIGAGYFVLSLQYAHCADDCSSNALEWKSVFDATGSELQTRLSGLERGESRAIPVVFSTVGLEKGSYRLRILIDPDDEISEMNELNNEMSVAFSIGDVVASSSTGGTSADLPNLAFRNVSVTPSTTVGVGQTVKVAASVVNAGVRPAGAFTLALQWRTPTGVTYTLLNQRLTGLNPGQVWDIPNLSIQTSLPMGSYAVIGTLDTGNEIAESSESDNALNIAVAVGSGEGIQPDLVPVSVRMVPSSADVETGQEILVYTTVQNTGALASGTFAVRVTAGDIVAMQTWPGLEPLQSVELVHSLGTPGAGAYEVTVRVDVNEQVAEANESNNTRTELLQISAAQQDPVTEVIQGQGPVLALSLNSTTGTLYAAWSNGAVRATDRNGTNRLVYSASSALSQMVCVLGVQDVAYLGTTDGRILAVNLTSGALLMESAALEGAVVRIVAGSGGALYVSTAHRLYHLNSALTILAEQSLTGTAVDIGFDATRGGIYVATSTGVYSFDATLAPQCSVTNFAGTPSALAVGNAGVYVGTSAGTVRALTLCQITGGSGIMMLDAWRYPRNGTLGGAVTTITVDARDVDPIYVTTATGVVHALDFTGQGTWVHQRAAIAILAVPAIDSRSGRFFYADDAGIPTILDSEGAIAVSIDAGVSQGSSAMGNLIVDEARRQTQSGMRLVRIYYFGASDGWVYKIETTR